ncbi:MAG: hypothetical protein IJZ42_01615 [Lachnospiraceae bacterium]|nr:hypothetical protein [Lachnospiraceae bacterium]
MKKIIKNFPWLPFIASVIVLVLGLTFKAYNTAAVGLAAVGLAGILGSFAAFIQICCYEKHSDAGRTDRERES